MTRTVVHVLRHGEVHNPAQVLYGRLSGFRLSEVGVRQAELVAAHLAEHDVKHVVASPLQRAQETAEPVAARHQLDVATDERLIEADNVFEGQRVSVGNGALRDPRNWSVLYNPFRPSWGEPYRELVRRMLAAVHGARELAAGGEAVCVSHQLPIWALRCYLAGRRLWHNPHRRQCALASLTSLVFTEDVVTEVVYTEPAGDTNPRQTGA